MFESEGNYAFLDRIEKRRKQLAWEKKQEEYRKTRLRRDEEARIFVNGIYVDKVWFKLNREAQKKCYEVVNNRKLTEF